MARSLSVTAVSGSSRNRGVLLVAALCAILSGGLMFAFLNSRGGDGKDLEDALSSAGGAETVVIVTRNVAVGEKITSDMLTTSPIPPTALLENRYTSTEDLIGRVTTAPIFKGEQVTDFKVTTFLGQNSLAYKVPTGMRAISVMVPHEAWATAGLIQPGDRVDVMGITTLMKVDPLTGEEKPNVVAGLIAQDVEVLAVSQTMVRVIPKVDANGNVQVSATPSASSTATATDGTNASTTGAQITDPNAKPGDEAPTYQEAISVTLALSPELAGKVGIIDAMKDEAAQFRLMPRQKGDTSQVTGTTVWSFDDLFIKK